MPARRDCSAAVDCLAVAQGTWSLTDPDAPWPGASGRPERGHSASKSGSHSRRCSTTLSRPWQRASTTRWLSWVERLGAGSAAAAKNRTPSASHPTRSCERPPDFVAPIEVEAGIVLPPVQQYALIENALAAAPRARDGQRSGTRSPRSGPVSTPWRPTTPTLPSARRALRPRSPCPVHATARSRTPTTSGTPVSGPWTSPRRSSSALRPVPPRPACPRTDGSSRTSPSTARGRSPDRPANARRVARDGRAGPCRRAPCRSAPPRPQARRGVLVLPGGGPGAAARARARPLPHPHSHRRHDFRRRPLQPLRAAVALDAGVTGSAQPDELGLVTTVSGMLSKPGLALWSATPPSPGAPRWSPTSPTRPSPPPGWFPSSRRRPPRPRRAESHPSPSPTAAPAGSHRYARRSWRTCPMGSAPPPPAKMQTLRRLAVAEGLTGRAVEVKDTSFSL